MSRGQAASVTVYLRFVRDLLSAVCSFLTEWACLIGGQWKWWLWLGLWLWLKMKSMPWDYQKVRRCSTHKPISLLLIIPINKVSKDQRNLWGFWTCFITTMARISPGLQVSPWDWQRLLPMCRVVSSQTAAERESHGYIVHIRWCLMICVQTLTSHFTSSGGDDGEMSEKST